MMGIAEQTTIVGFSRMMEDAQKGIIDCIWSKTFTSWKKLY